MDQIPFRKCARAVSILQLVLLALNLPLVVILLVLGYDGEANDGTPPDPHHHISTKGLQLWYNFCWSIASTALECIAAVQLFRATKIGVDFDKALSQLRFWRTAVVLIALVSMSNCALGRKWTELLLEFFASSIMLAIVSLYMSGIGKVQEELRFQKWQHDDSAWQYNKHNFV